MALLFKDDENRLECKKCGNRRIIKQDVFTYLVHKGGNLFEYLIETQIKCEKCNEVVKVITPERGDKILT
jgi:ribosomal protein S27E